MANFAYKARNKEGEILNGVVIAPNENIAYGTLRDKNLTIVTLREQKKFKMGSISIGSVVKAKDLVIFARQLSVMISSSVPIVRALRVLIKQTENVQFKTIISDIADEVDGGAKLSQSMAKYPKVFGNFFVQMIRSAETTGRLDEILEYLADQTEKDFDIMAKAKGAMIYPAFIMGTFLLVGVGMMMFVLPQITSIFAESEAELPLPTVLFMGLSDFLLAYWWLILAFIVILAVAFKFAISTKVGREKFDIFKIRMPIFGSIFNNLYITRFSRSLSTLIASGVPLTTSLDIVADLVSNTLYRDLTKKTIKKVEAGASITSVFIASKDVPLMLSQMMSVGEQSGQLDKILLKVAEFYTRELENSLNNLTALIEPIIMVVLGVGVGLLVSAIILPMYNLSDAI
ncbi:MAG: type II secretion system F family protein [Candidatus Kerfeldbacteria bacterium]